MCAVKGFDEGALRPAGVPGIPAATDAYPYNRGEAAEDPRPPASISASKGTDTSKVIVYWTASTSTGIYAAASYEVSRSTTFDVNNTNQVTVVVGTNFDDTTTAPGVLYYYWVRSVSSYGLKGDFSAYDTGYQALMPPQSIQASDGVYTNKVVLSWAAAIGAFSYKVFRAAGSEPASLAYHTDGLEFIDTLVTEGVQYSYQVQTVKGQYSSALSAENTGYVLGKATGVSATKGTVVNQVVISWTAVAGATGYQVWRSSVASSFAAAYIGTTTGTSFADSSAQPGTIYYYWVKAKSSLSTSGLSGSDNGYAAEGSVNLTVSALVVLPRVLPAGSHPAVLSFRMMNYGPSALAAPNTAMRFAFYMGQSADIRQAVYVGAANQDVTLAEDIGATVIINSTAGVTIPSAPGDYYVFLRAAPTWPNLMANANLDTSTMKAGVIHVTAGGTAHYWTPNDYDGDGISDMAVYTASQAAWSIRTPGGQTLWENGIFGGAGLTPTVGDYDGDHKADPATYNAANGLWSVMLSDSAYTTASASMGITGGAPMPGDYDKDGKADLVIYDETTGLWSALMSGSGYAPASGQFGAPGYRAVAGDYNGDGKWDLALYQEATGSWYIRTPVGILLKWGEIWGSPGYQPVSGDFDGDGIWDLVLYNQSLGHWIMKTMAGTVLKPTLNYWGGPGWISVSGDFNGDGIADQVVYQSASGRWYAITMTGTIIIDTIWGSAASTPVQWP